MNDVASGRNGSREELVSAFQSWLMAPSIESCMWLGIWNSIKFYCVLSWFARLSWWWLWWGRMLESENEHPVPVLSTWRINEVLQSAGFVCSVCRSRRIHDFGFKYQMECYRKNSYFLKKVVTTLNSSF